MDFDHPSQIKLLLKHLGPNFSEFNYKNEKGKFSYIKEKKKLIKFVNSDYVVIDVLIPCLISKSELYSIA